MAKKNNKKKHISPLQMLLQRAKNNNVVNPIIVNTKRHRDSQGNHPHIIIEDIGDKHVSVGLSTQSKKGKSKKAGNNYSLDINPLEHDTRHSYMRRQGTVDGKRNYMQPELGVMSEKDYEQAKHYADKAKAKYLNINKKNSNTSPKTHTSNKTDSNN